MPGNAGAGEMDRGGKALQGFGLCDGRFLGWIPLQLPKRSRGRPHQLQNREAAEAQRLMKGRAKHSRRARKQKALIVWRKSDHTDKMD